MTQFKSLTFCATPKASINSPIVTKRIKLIDRLELQRRLAADPNLTISAKKIIKNPDGTKTVTERLRRAKPWWQTDEKGSVVLTVRMGFKALEFEKGKAGIAVGSMAKLDGVLLTLIEAVRAGELDPFLKVGTNEVSKAR